MNRVRYKEKGGYRVGLGLSFQICSAQFARKGPRIKVFIGTMLSDSVFVNSTNISTIIACLILSVFVDQSCLTSLFSILFVFVLQICSPTIFFNFQLCVCPLFFGALHANTFFNRLLRSSQQSTKSKTLMKSIEENKKNHSKYLIKACHSVK